MLVAKLTQAEYKVFKRKVANLFLNTGEKLDFTVAGQNKRVVKVTLNKEYDMNWLDTNSQGVS